MSRMARALPYLWLFSASLAFASAVLGIVASEYELATVWGLVAFLEVSIAYDRWLER